MRLPLTFLTPLLLAPLAAQASTPPWVATNTSGAQVRVALPAPEGPRFAHLSWNKVVRTPRGTIVLACVAGEFHGNHGGGCPAVARSTDGGRTFSKLSILREFGPGRDYTCCGNLALGLAGDGGLVLLAMAYTGEETNHIFGWRSEDDGVTWTPVDTSTLGPDKTGSVFGNVVPIAGVGLAVLGHYRPGSRPHTEGIWMSVSTDHGRHWGQPRRIADVRAVEPVLLAMEGRLIAFLRSNKKPILETAAVGRQYIAVSDDAGRAWTTKLSALDAENPATARLAAPCAVENPNRRGELLVLTTERTTSKKQNSRIWLWRGSAKSLEFHRERVLLEFPKSAQNTDLGYPWLLHVEGRRWLVFYYHGQKHGPSPIWMTEVEL
jgi:hypothetical protein